MAAVIDVGTPLVNDPVGTAGVRALGVYETSFLRAVPARAAASGPVWSTWVAAACSTSSMDGP